MFCILPRICVNMPIMFDTSISLRPEPLAMRRRLLGDDASTSGVSRSWGVMLCIMDSHTLNCFSACAICWSVILFIPAQLRLLLSSAGATPTLLS